ncbi:hypothetical protein ACH5RR_032391 [Cinchona calisaya]|uniref:Putative plant transposon protein domain-containing protein n=1 Tax=Cinchona calisaya TaxID=153742 RepID=A0ABD2YM24_9GENT
MGNKRKVTNSTGLVESEVVHYQSHEPKVALDKNRFVSVEAQMFYDKLALIALPCLERGINFYGLGNDKIKTLTAPGEVRRAFLSEISDRTWSRFVREDATVGNDTIVRVFIANTCKLPGTVVQVRKCSVNFSCEVMTAYYQILNIDESEHAIFKRFDINYDVLLWELCDPHVPNVWYHFLTSRILPITHLTKVTRDRAVLLYALIKGWSIDIGLEIQMEILLNGAKDQPSFIFSNLITSLCTKAGVTLRIGSKISPNKPITGPWIRLTLKKHDKSLQDLIAKQQPRVQEEQVVLNSQNHSQQGTWELPPPAHPDYVFRRPHTELHPAQPLNLPNWLLEPDAPSWHFGPLVDDEYESGSEESENKYADHAADDEVGP